MRKTIEEMVKEKYPDKEVQDAVLNHARSMGTTRKIEKGELTLPSVEDAKRWHAVETAKAQPAQEDDE